MEANELRIGNWVEHNSDWCYRGIDISQFQWDTSDWYALGECTLFLENIEPIQLTEEWLIMFGFEKFNGRHGEYFKHKEKELLRVWISNTEKEEWGVGRKDLDSAGRKYNTHWIVLNIKHVHQLQNLYFALTGEELKLTNE